MQMEKHLIFHLKGAAFSQGQYLNPSQLELQCKQLIIPNDFPSTLRE
jgi:hypothetical protein